MEGKAMNRKIVITFICLMFAGCADREVNPTANSADVTYSIIDSDTFLDYKRSLDVRLNKKVSEDTLRVIALKLKAQDPSSYERTFVCYYLPGMEVGAGAWATTHFNPNLDIQILGLTAEQENALRQQPNDLSRDVIGSWLDESPFIGSRVTIFRQNGKLFIENTYTDGSSGKKEIVEKLSGKDRTFRRKEGSSVGEFYLIDNQGNLQLWDQEGIISTAAKIKAEEPKAEITRPQVVCNKFELVTEVTDSTLNLSVDTDLPDNTVVMVSVSRSYLEKGSPNRYSEDYFSEKSTIRKWKLKHRISIAGEKWKTALITKQEKLSRVGLGFDVASISDNITVHMVVPINQPDPRFGERNSKLTGKAVTMASKGGRTITGKVVGPMYVVEDEITIDYPLN